MTKWPQKGGAGVWQLVVGDTTAVDGSTMLHRCCHYLQVAWISPLATQTDIKIQSCSRKQETTHPETPGRSNYAYVNALRNNASWDQVAQFQRPHLIQSFALVVAVFALEAEWTR